MTPGFLGECRTKLPLRTGWHRALFALGAAALVLLLGGESVRMAAAAALAAYPQPAAIRRAIALDPANPQLYERWGLLDLYSLKAGPQAAVSLLREAAALDPNNGWYWESLGEACDYAGMPSCATHAFAAARALEPMTPEIEWVVANHDLLIGAPESAAAHFRRLLEIDPRYTHAVFAACARAYNDPEFVVAEILPAPSDSTLKLDYLKFLANRGDFPFAAALWTRLVAAHPRFTFPQVDPYLEKLISTDQIAQAVRVWRYIEYPGLPGGGEGDSAGNLVFDPRFEGDPLNAGFGWRAPNLPYVDAQFADPRGYRANASLRIDYTVPNNEASEPVYQLVPVAPGLSYSLSAWVRSDAITSSSGPRLRVTDPDHPDCLSAETPGTVGTTPWHDVTTDFSTCASTQLVRLSIWRARSYDFPNAIAGHFWVDDVTLEAVPKPPGSAGRRSRSDKERLPVRGFRP